MLVSDFQFVRQYISIVEATQCVALGGGSPRKRIQRSKSQQLELPPAGRGLYSENLLEMPPQVQPGWPLSASQDQLPSVKAVLFPVPPGPKHPQNPQLEYLTRLFQRL